MFSATHPSATAIPQTEAWEEQKARERAGRDETAGVLDDLPVALPALKRAQKLQKRAARVGFGLARCRPGPAEG